MPGSFFGASFFSAEVEASAFGRGGAAGIFEAEAEADADVEPEAAAAAAEAEAAGFLRMGLGGSFGLLWMLGMVNSS